MRGAGTPAAVQSAVKDPQQINFATLDGFFGYPLKRATNVMQADLNRALKPYGLRMLTYTALVLVGDNPGLRQSQLAAAMDVEHPNLVVVLDALESRDLILRERVPTDRRAYALGITLAGKRLAEKAGKAIQAHEARMLEGVDAPTRETVVAALRLIQKLGTGDGT